MGGGTTTLTFWFFLKGLPSSHSTVSSTEVQAPLCGGKEHKKGLRTPPAPKTLELCPPPGGCEDGPVYRADGGEEQVGGHGDVELGFVGVLAVGVGAGHVGDVHAQVELAQVPAVLQHLRAVQPADTGPAGHTWGAPTPPKTAQVGWGTRHGPGWGCRHQEGARRGQDWCWDRRCSPGQGLILLVDEAALQLQVAVALVVGAALLLELDLGDGDVPTSRPVSSPPQVPRPRPPAGAGSPPWSRSCGTGPG